MGLALLSFSVKLAGADRPLFPPLDLTIQKGEIVTLMAPSGWGKSTLLSAIAGLLPPMGDYELSGDIRLSGQSVSALPPWQRRIGMMFQTPLLFPHLNVADNLAFGLKQSVTSKAERAQAVQKALADAGLDGFGPRAPDGLSGGEKTRIALMRSLLAGPQALLLDEPFAALDEQNRAHIRAFVLDYVKRQNIPVLLVTHDHEDAAATGGPLIKF